MMGRQTSVSRQTFQSSSRMLTTRIRTRLCTTTNLKSASSGSPSPSWTSLTGVSGRSSTFSARIATTFLWQTIYAMSARTSTHLHSVIPKLSHCYRSTFRTANRRDCRHRTRAVSACIYSASIESMCHGQKFSQCCIHTCKCSKQTSL